ncbi:aspartyl protease [Candidatus Endobugula sertula]|uniref:Aspartyl protease n=1 Tax=Candidatus Endobugula sertula TaxID=62101 RepID=A0A1D2QQ09_9GAMM|nr:aspartyl protease [Candidatus Endobugula sertula]
MTKNTESPKASKIMMILAWATLLILLMAFFTNWEKHSYNPNHNPDSQQTSTSNTVVLQRNKYHHYVTIGKINQQTVIFLLDTGATDVVIPEKTANQLGLKKGARQYANTANGVIEVYRTKLEQLTIGNITLHKVNASINPSMVKSDSILLGMSALKDIEFTQRGEQLILKQYR